MSRYKFFGAKAVGSIQIKDNANLADAEVIVLGDKTYEWNDTEGDVVEGRVWLDRTVGTDALAAAELITKINANPPTKSVTAVIDPKDNTTVRLYADARGAAGDIAFTTTMGDSNNIIAAVSNKLADGENGGNELLHRGEYTVTALDVLADNVMLETSLPNGPSFFMVQCRTSAGLIKAITALFTVSGTKIRCDFAGATDPAAGDTITWFAVE